MNNLFHNPLVKFKRHLLKAICVFAFPFALASCEKFVAIDPPPTQITGSSVFADDQTATAAIDGIYSAMMSGSDFLSGNPSGIILLTGLSSDEFINFQTTQDFASFYSNSLQATNSIIKAGLWDPVFQYIYDANSALEGLNGSKGITPATKDQLMGESLFIRALCNFYLVNLYGDIPLVLVTDYRINSSLSRTATTIVYQQIIKDLKDAQGLLSSDYSFSSPDRTRPNRWAATALLARVYLYTGDWQNSEAEATTIIAKSDLFAIVPNLDSVFLAGSIEAIWQLQPVAGGLNTNEGAMFITSSTPAFAALTNDIVDSFEPGDARLAHWVGEVTVDTATYFFPFKYKVAAGSPVIEYSMQFRLAEQYLIRAEARAQQQKISDAASDLNAIRNRATLAPSQAGDKAAMLLAIEQERRVELFSEGHRWFDLKRTMRVDAILKIVKGSNWQTTDQLYPVPQYDRTNDPNLTQNPGY